MDKATALQKRTNRFLRASEIGLATYLFVSLIAETADPLEVPTAVRIMAVSAFASCAICLVVMFVYRNADEYTQSLWVAGTSTAFIATTILTVFGGFFEQLFYKLYMPDRLLDPAVDVVSQLIFVSLLFSFFVAVQIKRLITS